MVADPEVTIYVAADDKAIQAFTSAVFGPESPFGSPQPWPYGTVLGRAIPDLPGMKVMSLGNGTGIPLSGYAHTDYVPIPIVTREWEPVPEIEP